MMTFEQLDKYPIIIEAGAPFICLDEQALKQVQLDAWKQGMTDAAEIKDCLGVSTVRKAILTKRDNTTSLP